MIRVTPWFTDGTVAFLNGFLKWKDSFLEATKCEPTVLEVGGGSSTLYFLQKGLSVVSVESDPSWRERLRWFGEDSGIHVCESMSGPCDHDDEGMTPNLQLITAEVFADIPEWVFSPDYLLSVSDGIDRWEVLDRLIATQGEGLVIVDNLEFASDWGCLPISAGYPERAAAWRGHLRDTRRDWLLFEQPEGRDGHGVPDHVGIEREGRKISGITWRKPSVAASLGMTVSGTCLVSPSSRDDTDLEDLRERCPYPADAKTFNGLPLQRAFD